MGKLCKCGDIVRDRCLKCYPLPQHNKTTKERGYGSDWQRLSLRKRKENPLCEVCESAGIVTPARHVHHIQPIATHPHLRIEWSNLMSVCIKCHEDMEKEAMDYAKNCT